MSQGHHHAPPCLSDRLEMIYLGIVEGRMSCSNGKSRLSPAEGSPQRFVSSDASWSRVRSLRGPEFMKKQVVATKEADQ